MRNPAKDRLLTRIWLGVMAATAAPFGIGPPEAVAAPLYDNLDATRQRPLFAPTRRPAPAPAEISSAEVAPPVLSEPTPNFEVKGIILSDSHSIAILQRPAAPGTISVGLGGDVDGWTVTDIRPREITIRRDTRSMTLLMPEPKR